MPLKRRINKSRSLDSDMMEDLFYGPGTCLINGTGYLGPHGDGFWRDKSPEVQEQVRAQMRDDWQRHHLAVMAAWAARTPHDLYIAGEYHGNAAEPWAQTEFGEIK